MTQAGKGTLPDDHPRCLGALGVTGTLAANRLAADADLVLVLGSRLSDFTTASKTQFQHPRVRFVAVNVNAADAAKHGALPLVADARAALADLAAALGRPSRAGGLRPGHRRGPRGVGGGARADPPSGAARGKPPPPGGGHPGPERRACGPRSVIVHAAGGLPGDLHKLWRSRGDGDYHSEYGYSCMGYEIAGALGVKMARPDREVYAVVGDGSYLMLNHEIVTSVQEGRKITVVLLDNHGYQCIHNLQRSCGSAGFGNEFRHRDAGTGRLTGENVTVDFVANARSLGAGRVRRRNGRGAGARAGPGPRRRRAPAWSTFPSSRPRRCPDTRGGTCRWRRNRSRPRCRPRARGYQKALRARRFYY